MVPEHGLSRSGPPKPKQPFSVDFQFIDSQGLDDADTRRQIRTYAAKAFQRQRRWERNRLLDPKSRRRDVEIPLPLRRLESGQDTTNTYPRTPESESSARSVEEERQYPHGGDEILRPPEAYSPEPLSSLSSFRSDHFSSYPIPVLELDRVLVNHYACVYPDIMFRLRQSYNPVQTICFSEAMRGPSVFQATVMVISAAHLSSLRGFREQEMNSKAIQHKVKAIHMLNHGVRTITTETAVGILFGIVSLALAEDRFGDPETSLLHLRGALCIVEKFQESPLVKNHHNSTVYTNWAILTSKGYDVYSLRNITDDGGLANTPTDSPSSSPPPSSVRRDSTTVRPREALDAFNEFISLLLNLEHLCLSQSFSHAHATAPKRHNSFLPGSALHRLVTAPPSKRDGIHTTRVQRACRLASLIFIHATLWELRTSSSKTDQFLSSLESKVIEHGLDWNLSPESLILTIMDGVDPELDRDGRIWFTVRMVTVAKRLSRSSWNRVEHLLMRCLMMDTAVRDSSVLAWEGQLRMELLEAPLSDAGLAPAFS